MADAADGQTIAAIVGLGDSGPVLRPFQAPLPAAGQVTVRLQAAALNFADLLMLTGTYQETPPRPFVPGMEGAGVVIAAGPGVDLVPGTRVAVAAQGTLAQENTFEAAACVPIPDNMDAATAAAFQVAYGTSHMALTGPAGLHKGETLAVLGAGGGVGLTAVEIGAALGARVIACARGHAKLQAAEAAGASVLIDTDECPDLKAALRAAGGVDVVYDPVGDAPGAAAFGALRPGGRHLIIGFAGGKPPSLPLNHALVKNLTVCGFNWGAYRKLDPARLRRSLEALFGMYAAGKLHPHLGARLPLDRLDEGYALLHGRNVTGKVVIDLP